MRHEGERIRVVFDCNTIVQAMGDPAGPAGECVELVERGEIELLMNRRIVAEVREVVTYPRIRALSARMTDSWIRTFLKRLEFRAIKVRRVPHVMDFPRDPKDEIYMDLAAGAKAHYLVTSDKDLLSLMTDYTAPSKEFRRRTHPLRVVTPVEFLREVRNRHE
ncbi:MAG TPA: putative toxin-antitoxin system toxin component, PIN family [Phycisphaerae bacterium]|jgi:putative PIN family toxin of toxin-antitoxin system|nr:putative toxin-antitoxin system toxin component, PIN family [Phycisphaerae bacterium]